MVVILALLLALFCLVIDGTGEPTNCKFVVGSLSTTVQVMLCRTDGRCYYVSDVGAILETECFEHYFAEAIDEQ